MIPYHRAYGSVPSVDSESSVMFGEAVTSLFPRRKEVGATEVVYKELIVLNKDQVSPLGSRTRNLANFMIGND